VPNAAPGIFICYRRSDSAAHAGRLYDRLCARYDAERVFMDEEIPPAVDFVDWIEDAIGRAGVMIVVIGRSWAGASADGRRRLDTDDDHVRGEVTAAFDRGIGVLPVLVGGAEMPDPAELPARLSRLARLNALELRDGTYWRIGVDSLIERLDELLGERPPRGTPPPPPPPPERQPRFGLAIGLVGVALLLAGLAVLFDVYVTPHFVSVSVPAGLFTAPAPLGVVLVSLFAVVRSGRRGRGAAAGGLVGGLAIASVAKGASLLGDADGKVQGGGLLWIAGGLALGAAAVALALQPPEPALGRERPRSGAAIASLVGAVLLVVGAVIPFNVASPGGNRVVAHLGWSAADPIGLALGVVAAVALLYSGRRTVAAGALTALGIAGALLWVRYVGIPVAQWVEDPAVAAPRAGGIVGLAGSVVALAAGRRLAAGERSAAADTEPVPAA